MENQKLSRRMPEFSRHTLGFKLTIERLAAGYGAARILHGISLYLNQGETVVLLGSNGNGKSTLIKSVMGLVQPTDGKIFLEEEGKLYNLLEYPTEVIVDMGIALVPEGRRLFPTLTVRENLLLGAYRRVARVERVQNLEFCLEAFPALADRQKQLAGSMSGGEQQMLAIGRALMARPKILMMDEPSLGLAPMVVEEIFSFIHQLNQEGVTILLVEQNAHMALKVAHKIYLLEQGKVTFNGSPEDMQQDEMIHRAYLGVGSS